MIIRRYCQHTCSMYHAYRIVAMCMLQFLLVRLALDSRGHALTSQMTGAPDDIDEPESAAVELGPMVMDFEISPDNVRLRIGEDTYTCHEQIIS